VDVQQVEAAAQQAAVCREGVKIMVRAEQAVVTN